MVYEEKVGLLTTALRKPDAIQVRGILGVVVVKPDGTEKRGNCCLGVACHVAKADGCPVNIRRDPMAVPGQNGYTGVIARAQADYPALGIEPGDTVYYETFDGSSSLLPRTVQLHFGFASDNPTLRSANNRFKRAATWNDGDNAASGKGRDFGFIADAFDRTFR